MSEKEARKEIVTWTAMDNLLLFGWSGVDPNAVVVGGVVAGFAVASATSSGLVGNNKTQLLMVRTVCLYCMYSIKYIKNIFIL